ncbi:uncharacterized protein KY384_005623 [Bacidia gigantensis]|uniref:uncharacterized protein n=1 Tax=Bacidia gigantensis TaxID=2732470 RepID=UPI001D057BD5|nr:uncharacterized protein KY384_005623 [Bacidia gigantensis]KAG8530140.1 hypothetical protein KY384_005623 [Bacidia gigantensis]
MVLSLDSDEGLTDATYEDLENHISREILEKLRSLMQQQPPQQISWPVQIFNNGQFIRLTDKALVIHEDKVYKISFTPNSPDPNWEGYLTYNEISRLLTCLHSLAKPPTRYATVTEGIAYQQLYPTRQHCPTYASGKYQEEASKPSMVCGIILPIRFLEVDHQRPKSSGKNEAIMKVLRVLGLTLGRPHGAKCMQLHDCVAQALRLPEGKGIQISTFLKRYLWKENVRDAGEPLPGVIVPFVPVLAKDERPSPLWGSTTQDRYTLSVKGEIFYSVVRALAPPGYPLEAVAVHSLANLRPACGPCNKLRGKTSLKFP